MDNSFFSGARAAYSKAAHALNHRLAQANAGDMTDAAQIKLMVDALNGHLPHLPAMYAHCGIDGGLAVPGKSLVPRKMPTLELPFGDQIADLTDGRSNKAPPLPTVSSAAGETFIVRPVEDAKPAPPACVVTAFLRGLNPEIECLLRDSSDGSLLLECDAAAEDLARHSLLERTKMAKQLLLVEASKAPGAAGGPPVDTSDLAVLCTTANATVRVYRKQGGSARVSLHRTVTGHAGVFRALCAGAGRRQPAAADAPEEPGLDGAAASGGPSGAGARAGTGPPPHRFRRRRVTPTTLPSVFDFVGTRSGSVCRGCGAPCCGM